MVCGVRFMVNGSWSMVYGLGFKCSPAACCSASFAAMVYNLWFMFSVLWFMFSGLGLEFIPAACCSASRAAQSRAMVRLARSEKASMAARAASGASRTCLALSENERILH